MFFRIMMHRLFFICLFLFFEASHAQTTVFSKLILGKTTLEETKKIYPTMAYVSNYGVEHNKPFGQWFKLSGYDVKATEVHEVDLYFTNTGVLYAIEILFSGANKKKDVFNILNKKYKPRKIKGHQMDDLYAEFVDKKNIIILRQAWDPFLKKSDEYKFIVEYLHFDSTKARDILDKDARDEKAANALVNAL